MEQILTNSPYLRFPHLSGDLITFTAANDVWLAPVDGGRAWRLTRDDAPVSHPHISPDQTQVAFISTRDGHPEVYIAQIDSGDVQRLTYWGEQRTLLLGYAPDGRLLAATNAGAAHRHQVVRAINQDGSWERLNYGSASGLDIAESGAVALSTPWSRPPALWKRYRGGTAPKLWVDPQGKDEWFQPLAEDTAGLVNPMFIGEDLYFVSDRAATFPHKTHEQGNLWVLRDVAGGSNAEPEQVTFQTEAEGYVRDATSDGERIVWHSRGEIYLLESAGATGRKLKFTLPGTRPAPLTPKPTENLRSIHPDHGGDASLVSWRGKTFWLTHREGPAQALETDSGIRTRDPLLLGQTGKAVFVTDAEGEDSLQIHTLDGSVEPERVLTGQLGRVLHLVADPAGERLAAISHDGQIRLITIADLSTRDIAHSSRGEAQDPQFSPDGRYLLWTQPATTEAEANQLTILDTHGEQQPVALTDGSFRDFSPAFTRCGKYIAFLSNRTLDPRYDDYSFDLGFTGSTRPWLLPISATEPAPFGPSAEGWRLSPEKPETAKDSDKDTTSAPVSPELDADGAEARIVPFPVPSASYKDLKTAKDGVLWIKEAQDAGVLGSSRAGVAGEKTPDQLIRWDLKQRKASTIVEKVTNYAVSGDTERLVVRSGETVTVQPSTRKVEGEDAENVSVDLSRLRLQVDLPAEWQQMFDETCRLMGQQFWREDMDGIDWDATVARWRPVVAKVRSHDDLVDLLWEVVAELNSSHAYVMPTSPAPGAERQLGLLGADLSPAEDGWSIDRILPTESSEPEARSPLQAAGVNAKVGDVITAVDGHPVDPAHGPAKHLVGSANKPVQLTLRSEGTERRVVVVPLASETTLRYQDWVRSRREYVKEKTGGRLGYLHVPNMMAPGWAQLHRDLRAATRTEGVLADMRFNGGGHTSQLVIQKLAQEVVAFNKIRHVDQMSTYPDSARRGPVVLLANENSGSDGDIVNAVAQTMKLGPVVGVRTWGGVIGIDGRFGLVDGTGVTQPKYSYWIGKYGWGVENHGVDPDIEVIHAPSQLFKEDDPQLDRAIEEAFARLEQTPAIQEPEVGEPKNR